MSDKVGVETDASHRSGKYLTFRVSRVDFAIDAARVRGVLPLQQLVEVPATPEDPPGLAGYAAMGGIEFPVIDLRAKFGLPHGARGRAPCIVVFEAGSPEGLRTAGFIADRVSDLVQARSRDFHRGRLRMGRVRRLFDADSVFSNRDPLLD